MSKRGAAVGKNVLIKLIVGAGQAAPTPPVGPALGSKGVKAIDFCKEFNARTAHYTQGVPVPALVTVRPDRSFQFEIKSPPSAWLLMKAAGIEKGSADPKRVKVAKLSLKHIFEIAKVKKTDTRHAEIPMENIVKTLIGVAKSIGIEVVP
ncbi:large ribosomal subunit protein uL11m [Trichomonascus vanleenenianus]|uniref:mitochondrial 54S ribosomal protein uL11m MRPL19 n=1 Tax=Trichomonascus vanleenenianus TaxID=2268995 RepID=UPI003EC9DD09